MPTLQRGFHLEKRPVRKSYEGQNHISPEQKDINALGQIHVAQNDECGGLEKEQERHRQHIAGKRQQTDHKREKAEHPIHASHNDFLLIMLNGVERSMH